MEIPADEISPGDRTEYGTVTGDIWGFCEVDTELEFVTLEIGRDLVTLCTLEYVQVRA